jgi:hypothetical protein
MRVVGTSPGLRTWHPLVGCHLHHEKSKSSFSLIGCFTSLTVALDLLQNQPDFVPCTFKGAKQWRKIQANAVAKYATKVKIHGGHYDQNPPSIGQLFSAYLRHCS